jgi:hypothetical protein
VVKPFFAGQPANTKAPKQEAELFRYRTQPSILCVKFF